MDERMRMLMTERTIRIIENFESDGLLPREIAIYNVSGVYVPDRPFTVSFFADQEFRELELVKMRPVTIRHLFIHALNNSLVLTIWKFKYILYRVGFIVHDNPYEPLRFRDFTFNVFKTCKFRKLENKLDKQYFDLMDYMKKIENNK